ncbi:carboxypeptidase-like regulatory domain-containing protein [Winogradskyella undariae]|uniref:TonB-dependent receptor n=1 Tax=Winogradskyella TaxID=286104 RepID=UPI00156B7C0C|nr:MULTISPECIES: TonB-dependent receptor [Winogradskyella]NRR89985.1 carboxypeptidase-like regulatory domain-containing protein [Winogradskyella undariae]QXP77393.1 carboxypeptidase-like regulatory domain-containing protein [Winogradskyella sp. HaHa_3_26]
MKNFNQFLLLAVITLFTTVTFAQSTITGKIIDAETNSALPGANIIEYYTENGVDTDFTGEFTLLTKEKSGEIVISYVGFESKTLKFNGNTDFGTIFLSLDSSLDEVVLVGTRVIDLANSRETPVAVSTISGRDIRLKSSGNVEFGESMKNTPSVYVSNQAGGFGDSQIFLRGFDQTNTAYLLNGQPINGMEDGAMYWSNWSGMSDVANVVQVQRGLGSSKLAISSVGGTVNIVSKTTDKQKGGFVRFLGGNDSYVKSSIGYDSGLSEKGWAFSVLLDHWQAHRKYSIGTAGQGQNYMFSVGYKPNEKNTFNFLLTGAPQWHDQNFSQDLEFYQDYGDKANSNTGFYEGERYTERRNFYHKPVANLNWDLSINEKLDLSTVLYASWGRGGGTGNVGSGRVRVGGDGLNAEEIDFDQIELNNIATATTINGGQYGTSDDSYLRRSSINNHNWYGLLSSLEYEANENWSMNFGVDARTYNGMHFRQLENTLGLDGYNDNSSTSRPSDYVITETFDADPWSSLFNSADNDQRYDYNYEEVIQYIGGFGQAEYSNDNFSAFVQGAVSTQSYQREGFFIGTGNGLGKSDKISKEGYNIKGGLAYKINTKHSVFANAGFYSRQPFLDNIFSNVRYDNALSEPDVDNEEITGFEGGYRFKNRTLRINIDVYSTEWGNRFLSTDGPVQPGADGIIDGEGGLSSSDDELSTYRLTDVAQTHKGVEFDMEYRPLNGAWSFRVFGSLGDWKYDGETPYTLQNDDTGDFITTDGNIDLTDVKIGNAPQTSFGFGVKAEIFNGLSIDLDYNIYNGLYEFVDPADVADAALSGNVYDSIKLPSYSLLDAGLTYRFTLGDNPLTFRANIYNLLDESYINQKDAFGYYLGIGRTFNASLRYNF